MRKLSREELFEQLKFLEQGKLTTHEIYIVLHNCGTQNFQEARSTVEKFLKSDFAELRFVSLTVLVSYWHLEEYWEVAKDMLYNDPDEECRFRAASALGALKRNSQDRKTLSALACVVLNEKENSVVRESAYAAIKAVISFDPKEQFNLAAKEIDFKRDVDWVLVKRYCS